MIAEAGIKKSKVLAKGFRHTIFPVDKPLPDLSILWPFKTIKDVVWQQRPQQNQCLAPS